MHADILALLSNQKGVWTRSYLALQFICNEYTKDCYVYKSTKVRRDQRVKDIQW